MKTSKVKRFFTVIFLWPVYYLSYLFPRSKKIWVFGSFSGTFADNSKYLFLKQHHQASSGVVPVWITKSRAIAVDMRRSGYRSYTKTSLRGIYYCLRASLYIYSWTIRDINFWLSGGAACINLWHGLPFKKVGIDNDIKKKIGKGKEQKRPIGMLLLPFLRPSVFLKADYFLSTRAPEVSQIYKHTFPSKRLIHAPYPRVEHFVMPDAEREAFIKSVSTEEENKLLKYLKKFDSVWIYMPTFRDNKDDKHKMYAQEVFDFDAINEVLKKKNILLLVKYHYVVMKSLPDKDKYSNVMFINSKTDVYVILPYTSGLITDYSSVFHDYMLLQKPMLFYAFDLEEYQSNSRELYFPYDEVTCGPKLTTFKSLCKWFEEGEHKKASFDYHPYIMRFWGEVKPPFLLEQLHDLYVKN